MVIRGKMSKQITEFFLPHLGSPQAKTNHSTSLTCATYAQACWKTRKTAARSGSTRTPTPWGCWYSGGGGICCWETLVNSLDELIDGERRMLGLYGWTAMLPRLLELEFPLEGRCWWDCWELEVPLAELLPDDLLAYICCLSPAEEGGGVVTEVNYTCI